VKVGDRITVMCLRHACSATVTACGGDRFFWVADLRLHVGSAYADEEGVEWIEGVDPEQRKALLAAYALMHDTQPVPSPRAGTHITAPVAAPISVGELVSFTPSGFLHRALPGEAAIGRAIEISASGETCKVAIS
jgi:hypothetical protein